MSRCCVKRGVAVMRTGIQGFNKAFITFMCDRIWEKVQHHPEFNYSVEAYKV